MNTDAQGLSKPEEQLDQFRHSGFGRAFSVMPSWAASALLHLLILLIFCQIQWNVSQPEKQNNTVIDLKKRIDPVEREEPDPVVPDDPQITDQQIDVPMTEMVQVEMQDMQTEIGDALEPIEDALEEPRLVVPAAGLASGPPRNAGNPLGGRTPRGIRTNLIVIEGGREVDKRTKEALGWLARVQEPDGHWDAKKWGAGDNCDTGVTGLALLAFLGHGETDHRPGPYRQTVHNALAWLEKQQKSNGSFGERFYTQGICTMATSEAFGLTRNPHWGAMAQKAIDFCCENQNPNGGWDYGGSNPQRVDTSVSGWVIMGLKSGVASGLNVPAEAIDRIDNWLKTSINPNGTTGYTKNIDAQGTSGGTPPMTAVATTCRMFMSIPRDDPSISRAMDYLHKSGLNARNFYHMYYATLAMHEGRYQYPQYWQQWDKAFRPALLESQVTDDTELRGSWHPDVTWGKQGGRVYSTALAVLSLEVYYRYLTLQRTTF